MLQRKAQSTRLKVNKEASPSPGDMGQLPWASGPYIDTYGRTISNQKMGQELVQGQQ